MVDLVETVICRDCGEEKPRVKPQANICQECYNSYMREYNRRNNAKVTAQKREFYRRKRKESPEWVESERKRSVESWHKVRREVFNAYGGMKCACCGETEETFLTLDHINNDGASHRRELSGKTGKQRGMPSSVYSWAKRHNYPPVFQVLCMNCNFSKFRNNGVCAHQAKSTLKTA
jgi:hypothetical protein